MKLTIGKLVWGLSFILFLLFSYNQSTFQRVWDIFFEDSSIVYVQKFVSPVDTSVTRLGSGNIETELSVGSGEDSGVSSNFIIEVEKMKWKMEQLEEDIDKINIKMERLNEGKDRMFDDLIAIIATLSPLLIPIITIKYTDHKKQIIGKKS
jgi:hypothetical protein